ncbi:hypothetical protein [Luteolibacter sp. LG18]|uniref:hypothetical protein n=1 Tax=Luteolibacter sp. LG18 TaxID=2819286 RepID=UPI002B317ADB|nr:hypothetical protein llg_40180 [Luteolibacter sp. LG18]
MKPNLIYTTALDAPGSSIYRNYAKLLVSSLLRTGFSGHIIVLRNHSRPLFLIGREGVEEIEVETEEITGMEGIEHAWSWKYRARHTFDAGLYDKIMFIDADCLALHNVDPLFEGEWDIRYHPEPGSRIQEDVFCGHLSDAEMQTLSTEGVNSGVLMVKSEHYPAVMEQWEAIDGSPPVQNDMCSDQASWNRLLLDSRLRKQPLARTEVALPLHRDPVYQSYSRANLVHLIGGSARTKTEFAFGLFMGKFYTDPQSIFFNFLEI